MCARPLLLHHISYWDTGTVPVFQITEAQRLPFSIGSCCHSSDKRLPHLLVFTAEIIPLNIGMLTFGMSLSLYSMSEDVFDSQWVFSNLGYFQLHVVELLIFLPEYSQSSEMCICGLCHNSTVGLSYRNFDLPSSINFQYSYIVFPALLGTVLNLLASFGPAGAPRSSDVQNGVNLDGITSKSTHAQRQDHQTVSDGPWDHMLAAW